MYTYLHLQEFPPFSHRYANIIFYPFRTSLTRLDVLFFPRSCSSVILLLYTLPLLQHLYMNCNQDDQLEFPDNVMQLLHKRPCPFNNLTDLVILVCRTLPA